MTTLRLPVRGPFSLAASTRFLEGFAPARYRGSPDGGPLRLAFPVEGSGGTVGVAVRQDADGGVLADVGPVLPDRVATQLARILSLDVDGSAFPTVAAADPVVAELAERYPGLRPVCFFSPYEAACWAVLTQRSSMVGAAAVKERIAQRFGQHASSTASGSGRSRRQTGCVPSPTSSRCRRSSGVDCGRSPRLLSTVGWTAIACAPSRPVRPWPRFGSSPAWGRSPRSWWWCAERVLRTSFHRARGACMPPWPSSTGSSIRPSRRSPPSPRDGRPTGAGSRCSSVPTTKAGSGRWRAEPGSRARPAEPDHPRRITRAAEGPVGWRRSRLPAAPPTGACSRAPRRRRPSAPRSGPALLRRPHLRAPSPLP